MNSSRTSEQARHRRVIQRLIAELASLDPEDRGPDASRGMMRVFLQHQLARRAA